MSLGHSNSALELETLLAPELAGSPDSLHSSALFSSPARASLEQVDVPKGRRAAIIDAAGILIDEGVKTPEELAARLDKLAPNGALRQYSCSFWRLMSGFDSTLTENPDWQAIYAKLGTLTPIVTPSTERPRRVKDSKPPKSDLPESSTPVPQDPKARAIKEAIATMPPMYQQALELSQSGLSIPEIAERMNRSETAANSLVWVSAQKLRLLLETNERKLKATVQGGSTKDVEMLKDRKNRLLPTLTEQSMQTILKALATPDKATLDQIKRNPSNKKRLLAEWAKKSDAIKKDLKREGYDIDLTVERFEEERRLAEACIPQEIRPLLARADAKTQAVVRAVLEGRTWREASEDANLPIEKARSLYDAFRVKVNEWNGRRL